MAHQIGIVMAHYRCVITIWDTNGAPEVRHYYFVTNGVIIVAHL